MNLPFRWRKKQNGEGWELQVCEDGEWRKASDDEAKAIQAEQNRIRTKPDPRQQGPI